MAKSLRDWGYPESTYLNPGWSKLQVWLYVSQQPKRKGKQSFSVTQFIKPSRFFFKKGHSTDKQLFAWLTFSTCSFLWVLHQETGYMVDNAFNNILPPTQHSISYGNFSKHISPYLAPLAINKIRSSWRIYFQLPHPAERVPPIHAPTVTRLQ